jgi:hypothetical protein
MIPPLSWWDTLRGEAEATLFVGGANAPPKNEKIVVLTQISPYMHPP